MLPPDGAFIANLNPVATWSADTSMVLNLLYDALYQARLDGSIAPQIVSSANVSADGKAWTFTLRDDFRFSDGEPLTAQDVAFSYNLYGNEINSFLNVATEPFASVDAPDDRTVVITLLEAIPNMESLLVGLPVLPEHVWSGQADAVMDFANSAPVGSGPFIFANSEDESLIRLVANQAHPLQAPQIDELYFRAYAPDDLATALLDDEVDLITEVTTAAEATFRAQTRGQRGERGEQPVIDDIIFDLTNEETCPRRRESAQVIRHCTIGSVALPWPMPLTNSRLSMKISMAWARQG